jgi:hypothetical protein
VSDHYPRPDGDPGALRTAATAQRRAAAQGEQAASSVRTRAGSLAGIWTGETSVRAQASMRGYAGLLDEVESATRTAAGALDAYADALETAQDAVDDLNADFRGLEAHRDAVMRAVTAAPADDQAALEDQREAWSSFWAGARDLDTRHATAERTFEDAAVACLRALESTLPGWHRGRGESLDDWVQGMMTDWVRQVPVLRDHIGSIRTAVWAAQSSLPAAVEAVWTRGQGLLASVSKKDPQPLRSNGLLGHFLDGKLDRLEAYVNFLDGKAGPLSEFVMGTDRTANLASVASADGLRAAGLVRSAGIVGGVVSTGVSLTNVVVQGNPIDAFHEKGAAYVADVAEVGFNASMTAAMIAPNPVTVGAVVATGVVYAGAEIWAHREEIAEFAQDAWESAGDAITATGDLLDDVAHDAAEVADRVVDGAADLAKDAVSFLNPFD